MTEGINEHGLIQKSYNEILSDLQNGLNGIYAKDGEEINFDSNTEDGQLTNIVAQIATDIRELNSNTYNSFNPDNIDGEIQDMRYALNYLERKQGSFTVLNIDVTVNQTVELQGLDGSYADVSATSWSVSDNAGNLWYLVDTVTLTADNEPYSLPFRSANYGRFEPTIGTITNIVTPKIGVVSVNNPIAPTSYGKEEESSVDFKIRRARSTSVKGQNNIDSMVSQIFAVEGVTDVSYHINKTSETDETGTEPYTMWLICEGGSNVDIAQKIYENSCGLPTRGDISVELYTVSGEVFDVNFDRVNPVELYVKFIYRSNQLVGSDFINKLKAKCAENITFLMNETAETSNITTLCQQSVSELGGDGYCLNVQISTDNSNWVSYIKSESLQNKFVVSANDISITNVVS